MNSKSNEPLLFIDCIVCVAAVEFNCISDLEINFGIAQLALSINIANNIRSFNSAFLTIPEKRNLKNNEHITELNSSNDESFNLYCREGKVQKSFSNIDKKSLDDSGVGSQRSFSNKKLSDLRSGKRKISTRLSIDNLQAMSYEIGFVSGKFTIKCIVCK